MARRMRGCVAPECERRAEPGSMVCSDHRWTALGAETDREIVQLTQRFEAMSKLEDGEARREAAATFRKQIGNGDYAALQSAQMLAMLNDQGADTGLQREIGMLRVAMLRVLHEEEQPSRMAHALAKLSFALGRTMKLQLDTIGNERDAADRSLAETLQEILTDLDRGNQDLMEPWTVDPFHPSERMVEELRKFGIEPGSLESVEWLERWQLEATRELAHQGNRQAQLVWANQFASPPAPLPAGRGEE